MLGVIGLQKGVCPESHSPCEEAYKYGKDCLCMRMTPVERMLQEQKWRFFEVTMMQETLCPRGGSVGNPG